MKSLNEPPKVLVYTEYDAADRVATLILAGADSYVHKSVDQQEFVDALRRTHAGERTWLPPDPAGKRRDQAKNGAKKTHLTRKERQVFALILQGHSNVEIADELFVSPETIKTHSSSILQKLVKRSRREFF